MREIGSEFWDVITTDQEGKLFPERTQWYLSGRGALQAITKELHWAKSVAMPSWCCYSMIRPFVDAGLKVNFYPVYIDNGLVQDVGKDNDVLFVMDYFGYVSDAGQKHSCIIRDMTHSIFSKVHSDADYYFGSLRKWCGIWTGGYAWAADGHSLVMENADDGGYTAFRRDAMQLKDCYINRRVNSSGKYVTDKGYLQIYEKAEALLDNVGIAPASNRDVVLARWLDLNYIMERRRANAKVLMDAFPKLLIFPTLKESDCPMFVPVFVPNGKRDELRQYLIQNNIYCPVHWPVSVYHRLDEKTKLLYDNELSLVCDQRYSEKDMYRMVQTIDTFLGRDN